MTPAEMKQLREEMELTQTELAQELGVDMMTVSRWERGRHPIPKYIDLAVSYLKLRRRMPEAEAA